MNKAYLLSQLRTMYCVQHPDMIQMYAMSHCLGYSTVENFFKSMLGKPLAETKVGNIWQIEDMYLLAKQGIGFELYLPKQNKNYWKKFLNYLNISPQILEQYNYQWLNVVLDLWRI